MTTEDDTMRKRGDWMSVTDDQILETLDSSGLVLTPSVIAKNVGFSREQVQRRLNEFLKKDFVDKVDRGYYEIAGRGRAYLRGDFDAATLD